MAGSAASTAGDVTITIDASDVTGITAAESNRASAQYIMIFLGGTLDNFITNATHQIEIKYVDLYGSNLVTSFYFRPMRREARVLFFGHVSSGSFARYSPMNFGTYPPGTAGATKWDELSVKITNVAEGGRVEVEIPGQRTQTCLLYTSPSPRD